MQFRESEKIHDINRLEEFLVNNGENEITDEEIWEIAKNYEEEPNFNNIYYDLVLEKAKQYFIDEYKFLKEDNFNIYINDLDTDFIYKDNDRNIEYNILNDFEEFTSKIKASKTISEEIEDELYNKLELYVKSTLDFEAMDIEEYTKDETIDNVFDKLNKKIEFIDIPIEDIENILKDFYNQEQGKYLSNKEFEELLKHTTAGYKMVNNEINFYGVLLDTDKNIHKQFKERKDEIYKNMFSEIYDKNKEILYANMDNLFLDKIQTTIKNELEEIQNFNSLINIAQETRVYENNKLDLEEMLNEHSFYIHYSKSNPTIEIETWTNKIEINNIYQIEIQNHENFSAEEFQRKLSIELKEYIYEYQTNIIDEQIKIYMEIPELRKIYSYQDFYDDLMENIQELKNVVTVYDAKTKINEKTLQDKEYLTKEGNSFFEKGNIKIENTISNTEKKKIKRNPISFNYENKKQEKTIKEEKEKNYEIER